MDYNFGSIKGFLETAKKYMFPSTYPDEGAMKLLNEWKAEGHGPLVQIADAGCGDDCRLDENCSGVGRLTMATAQQEHLKIEQLQHASADELEVMAGRERENLEGWVPALASEAEIREALEKAFDYRGDITITRKDGSQVEGYLFDRRTGRRWPTRSCGSFRRRRKARRRSA